MDVNAPITIDLGEGNGIDNPVDLGATSAETGANIGITLGEPQSGDKLEIGNNDAPIEDGVNKEEVEVSSGEEEGTNGEDRYDESSVDAGELSRYLQDEGILPKGDIGDDYSMDDFHDAMEDRITSGIKSGVESILAGAPKEAVDYFNHLKNGGSLQDYQRATSSDYGSVAAGALKDNVGLQGKVLFDYYKKTTGWDNAAIDSQVKMLTDSGVAETNATNALKHLQAREVEDRNELAYVTQQNRIREEAAQKAYVDKLQVDIMNTESFMGVNLSTAFKNDVIQNTMNDVTYNKLNADFDKYRHTLVMLDEMGVFDNPESFMGRVGITKQTVPKKSGYNIVNKNRTSSNSKQISKEGLESMFGGNGVFKYMQ